MNNFKNREKKTEISAKDAKREKQKEKERERGNTEKQRILERARRRKVMMKIS